MLARQGVTARLSSWHLGLIGDDIFTERVISIFAGDGPRCVFATDLDGDGDTDVLSASQYRDKITWYENTQQPTIPILSE